VLTFDDASITRVMIAATAIPRRSHGRWLLDMARRVETAPRRAADAHRQAQWRRRQRDGVHVYRIEVGHDAIEALIVSGCMSEAEALDQRAVARELADVIEQWAQRWLR